MRRKLRRIRRYAGVGGHVLIAIVKVRLFWRHWTENRKRQEIQTWSKNALSLFGFRVQRTGVIPESGARSDILVANHTSWLDIFAIMSHTPASFVAKEELRNWPIFGRLAVGLDTIFLCRNRRSAVIDCLGQMSRRLSSGTTVAIFPESTTTDGSILLPFHASLFEAAVKTGTSIQPIAIRYLNDDGRPATAAAFTGEMSLVESFRALADCCNCVVEVTYLPPISIAGANRQTLAAAAERAIRNHLASTTTPDRPMERTNRSLVTA